MTRLRFLLFLAISSAVGQTSLGWREARPVTWGAATEGWQLALFSEKQSYFPDEPIHVQLTALNTAGRRRVSTYKSIRDVAVFTITRVADKTVIGLRPAANEAERRMREVVGGTRSVELAAGGLVSPGFLDLRALYDLPPGTYTVQAVSKLPNLAGTAHAQVPSNQITFSVVAR